MKKVKNFNENIYAINVLMDGGLGNQIFQYLAGRFVSNELNCDSIKFMHVSSQFPAIKKLIDCSEIQTKSFSKENENYYKNKIKAKSKYLFNQLDQYLQYKFGMPILSNNLILKEEINLSKIKNDLKESINHSRYLASRIQKKFVIILDGFWQDPMQYNDKLDFLSNKFSERLLTYSNQINLSPNSYITIHARRGDYVNNSENSKEYYSNYSLINFIMASLNIIPSELDDLPVILITDDIEWFKKFNINRLSMIKRKISICEGDEIIHWQLMNNARLNIISNSTFSFTSALLNKVNSEQKLRIIMPFWFNTSKSMLSKGWAKVKGAVAI